MTTFFLAFCVLACLITAMSIGVIMGRKPIKGSCGGMAAIGMETECDICGGDQAKCEKEQKRVAEQNVKPGSALAYDATTSKE